MDTKLTLKLSKSVIEKAKHYAADHKISLSRIIEAYLQSLISEDKSSDFEISPFVQSMSSGSVIPTDIDHKKQYADHLVEKYK